MIPRAIIPNVYLDNVDPNTLFVMFMIVLWFIIGCGFMMFVDYFENKELNEKFAKATKEYTDDVINTSFIEKGTFYKGDKYSIKKIKTLLEDYGYTVTKLKGKK